MTCLDSIHHPSQKAPALFNSSARFGDRNQLADTRHPGGFFSSVHRYRCVQFVAGRSGDTFGYAGFQLAGSPTPLRACPLRLATKRRHSNPIGGHHA